MELITEKCIVRTFKPEDAKSLAYHAANLKIEANMRDNYPKSYSLADAEKFITDCLSETPKAKSFAVVVNDEVIGTVGYILKDNVYKLTTEVGYWIGEDYWGKGITVSALKALVEYIFKNEPYIRLYGEVFSHNAASMRVIEKAGFTLEARLKNNVFKNGAVLDSCIYRLLKEEYLSRNI